MKKYFIRTYGCQMNESDSERIADLLERQGNKSAPNMEGADLIVVVACSVRQTAADRIFGLKKRFKNLKSKKILTGCVLKSDKKKFQEFFDEVSTINEFLGKNYLELQPKHSNPKSAFVPIMTGCNNFCTYCVVPYTRSREISRKAKNIISEIKRLIKGGCKELILLGQNVNSYKDNKINFPKLLKLINQISGDFIIKFLTSHPKDFSDELINTIAKYERISKEIHLPVQSGDNEILRRMNRGYTIEQYKKLIQKIRKKIPNVKITTDVIVGFSGETKKQFENTVKLFQKVKFSRAYINKYSTRAGTTATQFKDNVPLEEKKRRWEILNKLVNERSKLIVVLGPMASGKSGLAVKLAKKYNCEIISADSRQVYKGMDIGTGKITKKEMRRIPHYCLDLVSPKTQFSVAQYRQKALQAIDKIYQKNKIPILCGGTGFYIQAVVDGLIIPVVKPDWKLRKKLDKKTTEELFKQLTKLDPCRGKNIDKHNRRRLIRAIEIVLKTGKPVPKFQTQPQFNTLFIGIKKSPQKLKELIRKRLLKRLKQGMVKEVENLKKSGVSWKRLEDFGLEYRYISRYLQGLITKEQMLERLEREIIDFSRRQMTWFKKYPGNKIHWIRKYQEAEEIISGIF